MVDNFNISELASDQNSNIWLFRQSIRRKGFVCSIGGIKI
jgi:hypothetical protein